MRYKKPILYINILLIAIIADMTIFNQTGSSNLLFADGEDNISLSHLRCNTKYPHLFSGALRMAFLDSLPNGEILFADELRITQAQLDAEIKKSPQELRGQLRNNAFFDLERMAIEKLLAKEARVWAASKKLNTKKMKEYMLIRNYLKDLTADVTVSTDEAKQFYQSNLDMFGGASFEAIQAELKKYLLNDKKQSLVETYLNDLGKQMTIKIDAAWAKSQYAKAIDNPVDKARRSGRPSVIDFGAIGCKACDMMEPILEELKKKYAEVINVEFINVRRHQILGERYGISSIPVQVFFDNDGREVYRHVGFLPKNRILEKLSEMGVTR